MADPSPLAATDSPLAPPPRDLEGNPQQHTRRSILEKLLGIKGPRYQILPERLARDVAHGLSEGAKVVKAAETGAYGDPGTHEFTDRAYKDVFTAAKDNFYPAEMFGAFHASGDILAERVPTWWKSVAPISTPKELASKLVGGLVPGNLRLNLSKNGIYLNSSLLDKEGTYLGSINRSIDLKSKTAAHNHFELTREAQGRGLAKQILSDQIELYQKLGIERITMMAGLSRGGYAWAKYGFLPKDGFWNAMRGRLEESLMQLYNTRKITQQQADAVRPLLQSEDVRSLWALSDVTTLTADGVPLGKVLLSGKVWSGSLNLKDKPSMERFNAYVTKRPQ